MESPPRETLPALFRRLKEEPASRISSLPILLDGRAVAWLEPVTWYDAERQESIALLASWRQAAADAFPSQFPVTLIGTQRWLVKRLLERPDRILFWITGLDGQRVGHVGLYSYATAARHAEIYNLVRGVSGVVPGIMLASLRALVTWTFGTLEMEAVCARVFADKERALGLFSQCGFRETLRMPLARSEYGDVVDWVEVNSTYLEFVSRYRSTLRLTRAEWLAAQVPVARAA